MDEYESKKALDKQSKAGGTNGTTRTSRSREVSSRYKSPTPSAKRCPSPNVSMTSSTSVPRRALSAERKRPPTTSRPSSPSTSTPVRDTTAELLSGSNKTVWPSTMRSLSNSFQSDNLKGKREKTVSRVPSDRTLRSSSNVSHKGETVPLGKLTQERKRSPLKGKNSGDQSENSKPVSSLSARLVDQHRWPSGKMSTTLNRSDIVENMKNSSLSRSRMVTPSVRRLSLDGTGKPLQKSASDLLMLISRDESRIERLYGNSVDDRSLKTQRPVSSSSSDRTSMVNGAASSVSLPIPGSRAPSPSVSRGVSPSRARLVNPSSRGNSPSRRPSSPSRNPQSSTSVLSFIADIKKGKKAANDIEDVHQLRLLYNRHLQWRLANARTDAALRSQREKTEKNLYGVWRIIVDLRESIREKRFNLQLLKLKLKLNSVLNNQVTFLDEWSSLERNHINSLTHAIQDLQASTVRIPVTGGARADIVTLKAAVCSAVDVMTSTGSSLCSILSEVEAMNSLISELADVASRERAMLDECETLLGSTALLQVEEYSIRSNLLQMKQAWRDGEQSIFGY